MRGKPPVAFFTTFASPMKKSLLTLAFLAAASLAFAANDKPADAKSDKACCEKADKPCCEKKAAADKPCCEQPKDEKAAKANKA